jgi:hypothetical protein
LLNRLRFVPYATDQRHVSRDRAAGRVAMIGGATFTVTGLS